MKQGASRVGIFPLPVIELPPSSMSHSRRVIRRQHFVADATNLANRTINALNTLNVSFSSSLIPPSSINSFSFSSCQARQIISSSQTRMLAHVYRCATRYLRCHGSSSMSVDSFPLSLSKYSYDSSFSYSSMQASVLPIQADRVSLPSSVGSADLLSLLPPELRTMYSSPAHMLRPAHEVKRTRRGVLCASPTEYTSLIKRMHGLGMVSFTTAPKVVNGVFAVPKDGDKQRLIIDARPANAHFVDPAKVELPTPDLLAQLVVPTGQPIYVAKVDLDNYYHRLTLPEWLRPYFALPAVRAQDVGVSHIYGADAMVHPCCNTLPMGWSHSVFVAQAAHENLLNTQTNLSPADRVCHSAADLNIDRPRHQLYIDDLNLFGPDPVVLSKLQSGYVDAAIAAGLPVKPSKIVSASSEGVECLGLVMHGTRHELGLSVSKLAKLCNDTLTLLQADKCTGTVMSQLVGKWTWAALVNRPLLSVFSAVYRFIESAGYRVFTIWASVKRELLMMVDLAPLMFATLTDNWFDRLVATDASETGQGVVAVKTSPGTNPFDSQAAAAPDQHHWSTIIASPWRRKEHINALEIRAVSSAVRWILSFSHSVGCHAAILCDSLVTVFSVTKGRSSSPMLLPRLRQLASLLLASGLRLYLSWVPSEFNPADAPSRAHEL